MNRDRIKAARNQARALFVVAGLAIVFVPFYWVTAPAWTGPGFSSEPPSWSTLALGIAGVMFELAAELVPNGLHLSRFATPTVVTAIGIGGVMFGLAWMWRIYKAPTKYEGAHWRFRDHD
jgi:hypothetical protein